MIKVLPYLMTFIGTLFLVFFSKLWSEVNERADNFGYLVIPIALSFAIFFFFWVLSGRGEENTKKDAPRMVIQSSVTVGLAICISHLLAAQSIS
jgi:hypothetical protein